MVIGGTTLREGERFKTCSECGMLGLCSPDRTRTDFYPVKRLPDGSVRGDYQSRCKRDAKRARDAWAAAHPEKVRAQQRRKYERTQADPERATRRKRKQRAIAAARRAHPERGAAFRSYQREYARRKWEALKADPVAHAAYLVEQRALAHARARARGVVPMPSKRRYPEPVDTERTPRLPMTLVFQRWVTEAVVGAGSGPAAHKLLGIDERNLRNITGGLTQSVMYDVADRMLSGGDGPPLVAFWPHLG